LKGFRKQDLNIVFTSYSSSANRNSVKEFLIRVGHPILESSVTEHLKVNLAGNKILIVNIENDFFNKSMFSEQIKQKCLDIPCLFVLHSEKGELNLELLSYCTDFVTWPCDSSELFFRMHSLVERYQEREALFAKYQDSNEMIGNSEEFRKVLKRIRTFSSCDAPVLIEGETGTGKEMIARAVHYYSERHDHPFIPVNCGAIPEDLIENELFGHARGAYTDAKSHSKGLVGQANGGTLFLDEVEALSLKSQVALLRFLQEQEYKPLGSNLPIKSNVRVVTASNINLNKLVDDGTMRQDLFFRLNILSVTLPPLRVRGDDIKLLAQYFLNKYRNQYHQLDKQLSCESVEWLCQYSWPGNIRELDNIIHRSFLISEGTEILLSHLTEEAVSLCDNHSFEFDDRFATDISFNDAKSQVIENFERQYLSQLMQEFSGNVTLAAKKACKERRAFGKLLKKHGIDRYSYL